MIKVNQTSYSGRSVTIINNKVYIDGKDVTPDAKEINISVEGDIEKLEVDYCSKLEVKGNVGSLRSGSGDVICGDVTNGLTTGSGDVTCGNIAGNVSTGSGDVEANNISGSVKTGSGDIEYRGR